MAQFSNVIVHGTINSAQGDLHINNSHSEVGLNILRLGVSLGAIHDSAERYPPPNCHPDTRMAVRKIILDWIYNESSASSFFWLCGPAGAGKTAILQAIAEILCSQSESDESLGGSFFFSRGKHGRDQGHFLFSTIAYQLALKVPGLREHVNRIMEKNPTLPTKSMVIQLQSLIVDAFQCLSPLPQGSYLVIIDGLDECQDKATQQSILRLLCEMSTVYKLPLRFLIGSRPEFQIRVSFDQKSLYTITRRVVLDETFNPGRDIEVFLRDGFATICAKNVDILPHMKQPWPEKGIIDLLVQRASGQFIYAATVLKFVSADFCNPTKQLALLLKPDPTAFSDLDQLYTQILSVYPSRANIVQVLGIILAFGARTLTPEVIGDILHMEGGDVKLVLRCVSSLIAFVGDEEAKGSVNDSNVGAVYFTHASFGDYLSNPIRSGPFHVNPSEHENQTTIRCFSLFFRSIGRSWRSPPIQIPHSETWLYFEKYLSNHFIHSSKTTKDAIMTDIRDFVQDFWKISKGRGIDISFRAINFLWKIFKPESRVSLWNLRSPGVHRNDSDLADVEHAQIIDDFSEVLDQSLRISNELGDLLRFLPGIVVQKGLSMQGMAKLYRVNIDVLERFASKLMLSPLYTYYPSSSRYILVNYLPSFLQDQGRSQHYYCDPLPHHIFICRHFLSLLRLGPNRSGIHQSYVDLATYAETNFYKHLFTATEIFLSVQNVSADHPAIQILEDLENTTYCYVDESQAYSYLVRCCACVILRWADRLIDRLKDMAVSISNVDLIQRVGQITRKIYREILCIEVDGNTMIVALVGVTPEFNRYDMRKTLRHWGVIQLSWHLLQFMSGWFAGKILSSFADFITTPEISGALYITPHVFHTQITEHSLESLYQLNNKLQPSPFAYSLGNAFTSRPHFEEHISRALPTKMIFYLLRSIPSRWFTYDDGPSIIAILETIIRWLEGLGSVSPTDLYDRFQAELSSEKRIIVA